MRYAMCLAMGALLVSAAGTALRADEEPLPSPAEIQKLVDSEQYPAAIRLLQRVLALNATLGAAYDRFDMLMLRGECELQLHQQPAAIRSWKEAVQEAFKQETPERAADPIALTFLVKNSVAYQYVPKVAGMDAKIPILDRSRRGEAFGALLVDHFPEVEKQVTALAMAKTIPPVLQAAESAGMLRALEYAQNRNAKKTGYLTRIVADKAAQMLGQALTDPTAQVEHISEDAQQLVVDFVPINNPMQTRQMPSFTQRTRRQGPTDDQRRYLLGALATCNQVSASALQIAQALDSEIDILKGVAAKADTLRLRIQIILNDNYLVLPPRAVPGQ